MQQKSELPEGWSSVLLEDYIDIAARIGWKGLKRAEYTESGPLLLAVKDILADGSIFYEGISDHLSDFRYEESPDIKLKENDILVTKDGTIGKIGFVDNLKHKATVNSSILVVRPSSVIDQRYLFHYFRSPFFQKIVQMKITGSAVPHIFQKDIKKFQVLIPPLPEQHRIVSAIEALFSRLDETNEKLDRVPEILKKFRQSVLAAACDGRLTEDWREANSDVKDKNEIIETESSLKAISKDDDENFQVNNILPNSWKYVTFKSIVDNFDGKRIPLKSNDRKKRQGDYPYYGASGIIDYIDDYIFDGKFLLISEDGANLLARNTPIAFIAKGQFWVNNHAHIVQTRFNIPLEYLEIFFNGFDLQYYITGSAQPKLTQGNLNKIQIPLPPLPEQHEIVRRVDALFAFADSIEAKVVAAREKTEKLRQSILAKAFSGKLVETEAEIAKREGREYESAEVLLERIKEERGKGGKKR